jgi:phosphate-selective porin OprO and OprP
MNRRLAAIVVLSIGVPVGASAQTGEPVTPETAPAPTSSGQTMPAKGDWSFGWQDTHPTLRFGSTATLHFRARMQLDARASEASSGDADGFDLSRRRIGVEGEIGKWLEFQVEREIDSNTPWRDVYVNYREYDAVQIQAGRFKLPFSLDENTSAANLDFMYRSRGATQLAPGRDRGVMVHGRLLDRVIGYQAGLFNRDGDNARTTDETLVSGERTFAARVTAQPFRAKKSPTRDLQLGLAVTTSHVPEGLSALRGRTALDAPFFPADLWVQGARRRVGLELRWRPGPYSVKAELMRVSTERREQSVEDTDLSPLVATAWYVSGTYLITGERKAAGGDTPRRPLFRGGYGAIEVAGRLENLRFGSTATGGEPSISPRAEVIAPNADRVMTMGVNWFPMRGVKVQANLINESIADPSRGPLPEKSRFWSRLLRLQISL